MRAGFLDVLQHGEQCRDVNLARLADVSLDVRMRRHGSGIEAQAAAALTFVTVAADGIELNDGLDSGRRRCVRRSSRKGGCQQCEAGGNQPCQARVDAIRGKSQLSIGQVAKSGPSFRCARMTNFAIMHLP